MMYSVVIANGKALVLNVNCLLSHFFLTFILVIMSLRRS